jgi:arylsulfatase A-like enzyme
LFLRLPPGLSDRRGTVVEEIVRTADIVPTLLDYLDLPASGSFDGRSLRALIEGTPDEPRVAYADQINGYDRNAHMLSKRPDAAFLYVVNDGEWKLIYRPHDPESSELFRVGTDPGELRNLYHTRPGPRRRLLADLAQREPWVTAPFPPPLDGTSGRDLSEALAALGYTASVISDTTWSWTCPEHSSWRSSDPVPCAECDAPPVPVPVRD